MMLRLVVVVCCTGCIAKTARVHVAMIVDDTSTIEVGLTVGYGFADRKGGAALATLGAGIADGHAGVDAGFDDVRLGDPGTGVGWRWGVVERVRSRTGALPLDVGARAGVLFPFRDATRPDGRYDRRSVHALGVEAMLARAFEPDAPDRWFGRIALTYEWFALLTRDYLF